MSASSDDPSNVAKHHRSLARYAASHYSDQLPVMTWPSFASPFERLSNSGLLPRALFAFGRMRDWQNFTHIFEKLLAKALSVSW